MELVRHLMAKLGLTEQQAKGSAGLFLRQVQNQLGDGESAMLEAAVPDVRELIDSAPPAVDGPDDVLGLLAARCGGFGNLAGLVGGLSRLGFESFQIARYGPALESWVGEFAPDGVRETLERAIGPVDVA